MGNSTVILLKRYLYAKVKTKIAPEGPIDLLER
jgi:hypothetical protein